MQPSLISILPANTTLDQRYTIVRLLRKSTTSAWYEAIDQQLGESVVLHQLSASNAASAEREQAIGLLTTQTQRALPMVHGSFRDLTGQFLVMEYLPTADVATLLARRGLPFAYPEVVEWADQLLQALEFLHHQIPPIIHGNITPQQLKRTPQGHIQLLSLGLIVGDDSSNVYQPIEQIQGAALSPASDLYALAATLYHLLTGSAPIDAQTRVHALMAGQADPLPLAQSRNAALPLALSDALMLALQPDPALRPASAAELRTLFQQPMQTAALPTAAVPTVLPADPRIPKRADVTVPAARQKLVLGGAILAVVLMLIVIAALFGRSTQPEAAASINRTDAPILAQADQTKGAIAGATPTQIVRATAAPVQTPTRSAASATPLPPVFPTPVPTLAAVLSAVVPAGDADIRFGPIGPQPVITVRASNTAPDSVDGANNRTSYAAAYAIDGIADTAWRVPGAAIGETLTLELGQPIQVDSIQILPGYAKIDPRDGTNRFAQNRRVRRIRVEGDNGQAIEAQLLDQPTLQAVQLNGMISASIRIIILETTNPATQNGRDFTPISEIVVIGAQQQ